MVKTLSDQTAYNALFGGLSDSRGWIGLFQRARLFIFLQIM